MGKSEKNLEKPEAKQKNLLKIWMVFWGKSGQTETQQILLNNTFHNF